MVKEKKVKVKQVKKVEEVEEPKELTPREKAWEHFCKTMEKYDRLRFERMKANGELDAIPKEFTY